MPEAKVEWEPQDTQAVMGDYFLRVTATRSPHRWRWSVIPMRHIERYGRAYFVDGKGPAMADARGHSATREGAEADAVMMARALIRDDAAKGPTRVELSKKVRRST